MGIPTVLTADALPSGPAEVVAEAAAAVPGAVAEPFDPFYRANVDRIHRALTLTLGNVQLAR